MEDTIVAIATSSGISSIGIIRISGPNAFDIIKKIFKIKGNELKIEHQTIRYGHIVDEGTNIDEVLVSFFVAPNSFTRENICEINAHGGPVILNKILELVLKNGARLADPGEFTKRAFLNGRIDLSQAEAIVDIINSKTDKTLKESEKQLEGILSDRINLVESHIVDILSDVEANIDYPEYDIEEITNTKLLNKINEVEIDLKKLEKTFDTGKILRDGISIALIGKPNVGKSSVLNMLLRENRAIVTEIAGTTRDTIEEYINIKGIPVKIIDTAGIRDTENIVEKIGVDRSINAINNADILLLILDNSSTLEEEDIKIINSIKNKNVIIGINKIDLNSKLLCEDEFFKNNLNNIIKISTKENVGLEALENKIYEFCNIDENIKENEAIISNARHKNIITKCINQIKEIEDAINNKTPIDIVSIKIMDVLGLLGEITGKTVSEEVINSIFSKFCLGK